MKLKKKDIDPKTGKGYCVLIPEEPDDMWHAYHLITKGDLVKSSTVRRIVNESATGSVSSEKVRLYLTLEISSIDFDSQSGVLRLGGKNVSESRFVKMGQFHTMQLEMNQEFTLEKEFWDSVAWDRIQSACDPTKYADAGAIVMQEGLAHVCLLTPTMTIIRAKIEVSIPRKRKGSVTSHDKGLERFFDTVMQAILRHYDFNVIKCIVIASPGFVKDQFFEYLMAEATRQGNKLLLENKNKFILAHSSTGHKHSLKDVLLDPSIAAKLADTKASGEVKALNDFYDMLKNDPDRAFYGIVHVEIANERLAIQTLLMTDELFRSADLKTRNRYVQLVESVKANGGEVKIFSTLHVSGEQLGQLGGVAAILRFPLPEIEELEEERMNQQKEAKEGKEEE